MSYLITIQAKKVKEQSGLYKGYFRTEFYKEGVLFATVPPESRQPKKGQKTYTINCWKWALEWIN